MSDHESPRKPLARLSELIARWPDEDPERISVVINQPLTPPTLPRNSDRAPKPPRWAVTIGLAVTSLLGALKLAYDLFWAP